MNCYTYRHEQCPETCLECRIAPVVDVEVCQQSADAEPLDSGHDHKSKLNQAHAHARVHAHSWFCTALGLDPGLLAGYSSHGVPSDMTPPASLNI